MPGVGGAPADDSDVYMWNGSVFSRVWDATADGGVPLVADVDGLTVVGADHFYLSFNADTTVGGMAVQDEDIVEYNTGTWSLFFDGTSSGPDRR